jgi:hypothetical protein
MREHSDAQEYRPEPGARHEMRDISTRVVTVSAAALIVGAIVVHLVVWLLFLFYGQRQEAAYPRQYPMAQVGNPAAPPNPRLQTKPREDLKKMRAEEEQHLNSYGWVDAGRGTLHIPIDRAMQILLEQGLPARGPQPGRPPEGLPQDSSSGRTLAPAER